jgi:hypothetical protein
MNDLFYVAISLATFAVFYALVKGLNKLEEGVGDE